MINCFSGIKSSCRNAAWRSRVVGRARATGNRVGFKRVSRVRIPASPPKQKTVRRDGFLLWSIKGLERVRSERQHRRAVGNASGQKENAPDGTDKTKYQMREANGEDGVKYSIRGIVDDSGKDYGIGVYLDSSLLDNLSDADRKRMVKLYVTTELAGNSFVAYDKNNNPVDITLARKNDKIKTLSGSKKDVLKELYNKNIYNNVKQEAVVLVDELIETAQYDHSADSNKSHDWLDNNGKNKFDYWSVYIQEKNKTVWIATLNVANTTNGEKVLYDIDPIKKVAEPIKSGSTTTNDRISQKDTVVNTQFMQIKKKLQRFFTGPGSNCPTKFSRLTLIPLYTKQRHLSTVCS